MTDSDFPVGEESDALIFDSTNPTYVDHRSVSQSSEAHDQGTAGMDGGNYLVERLRSEQQRRPPGAQSAGSDETVIPDDFDVSTAVPVLNAGYSGSDQASSHGDIERLYGVADWTFQAAHEGRWSLRPANGTSDRPSGSGLDIAQYESSRVTSAVASNPEPPGTSGSSSTDHSDWKPMDKSGWRWI